MDGIFLISRPEAGRICRNAFPPAERRAVNTAKHICFLFVLFSPTSLGLYCFSIFFSIFGHLTHLGCVWFAASHGAAAAYVSYSGQINLWGQYNINPNKRAFFYSHQPLFDLNVTSYNPAVPKLSLRAPFLRIFPIIPHLHVCLLLADSFRIYFKHL